MGKESNATWFNQYAPDCGPIGQVQTFLAQSHNQDGSLTSDAVQTALGGSQPYGRLVHWQRKLQDSPATARIVLLGDSTSYEPNDSPLYSRLRSFHTAAGQGLAGLTGDSAHIINGGNNGLSLAAWIANSGGTYLLANLIADAPDLVVFSFGLNDVRQHTDTFTYTQLRDLIITAVNNIRAALPSTDIVLRTPNGATTDNVSALNYVTNNAGTVNPPGAAQALTDTLRKAYYEVSDYWPNVVVWDAQTRIFGTKSIASTSTNLFANQIHPSTTGYQLLADYLVADVIGIQKMKGLPVGDGVISTTTTPWTVDPAALDDPSHFQIVYQGEYNAQTGTTLTVGAAYNRVENPAGYPLDVQPFDIVRLPDDTCWQLGSGVSILAQSSGGAIPNLLISSTTVPANSAAAGTVRVYRELDQGDLLLAKIRASVGANRWVRVGRIQNGATNFAIVQAEPLTAARVPSGQWGVTKADKFYVAGGGSNPVALTNYSFLLSGEHLQLSGTTFDFTNFIGRLIVFVGSHAPESVSNGRQVAVTTCSAAYGPAPGDEVILATASTAYNVTLPTAANRNGQVYTIKKVDASVNAITVATISSQTIDGAPTYSLAAQWKYVTVISDGSNWVVVANN